VVAITDLKDKIRDLVNKYSPVFYIAPTGFGKTTLYIEDKVLHDLINRNDRVIHVLPLRSIIVDTLENLVKVLRKSGINYRDHLGYQAGIDKICIDSDCVDKDPYMLSTYNVTTYDSYSLTLLVSPIPELSGYYGHYDVGYMALTTAINLFDEVHILLDTHEDYKSLYFLQGMTYYLSRIGARVAYMSATIHPILLSDLIRYSRNPYVVIVASGELIKSYKSAIASNIKIDTYEISTDSSFCKVNKEICNGLLNYPNYVKTIVSEKDVVEIAKDVLEGNSLTNGLSKYTHDRVAVIVNTVGEAVRIYYELKKLIDSKCLDYELFLLHGRLGEGEKSKRLKMIKESIEKGKNVVVVSTQVIEAGVNISFHTMITEIAIIESLIQRVGRLARIDPENECKDGPCLAIISISEQALENALRVYGNIAREAWIRLVNMTRPNEPMNLDWKTGTSPSIYNVLLSIDVEKYMDTLDLIDYSDIVNELISPVIYNVMFARDIYDLLRRIELKFGGSIIRSSPLLKLVILNDESKVKDSVTVSLRWLLSKGESIVKTSNGKPCYYLTLCKEECSEYIECRDIIWSRKYAIHDVKSLIRNLSKRPLTTIYRVQRYLSSVLGKRTYFHGLVVKEGIYSDEYGLP